MAFAYNQSGVPLHYIIDGSGNIVHGQYGSSKGFPKLKAKLKEIGVEIEE